MRFYKDDNAVENLIGMSIGAIVVAIIGLMLFGIMTSSVMPDAIDEMNDTTTGTGAGADWDDGLKGMWDMSTLMIVVAVLAIPVAVVIKLLT